VNPIATQSLPQVLLQHTGPRFLPRILVAGRCRSAQGEDIQGASRFPVWYFITAKTIVVRRVFEGFPFWRLAGQVKMRLVGLTDRDE